MSVIDELLKMDPACMPGSGHEFEHNLLIQECFGELEKRVKALEDHNVVRVHDVDKYYPEEESAPAPDLAGLVEHFRGRISDAYHDSIDADEEPESLTDILYAFAADLGYKP